MNRIGKVWSMLSVMVCALVVHTADACVLLHPPINSVAEMRVTEDGSVTIEVVYDAIAFALNDTSQNIPDGPMFALLDGPEQTLARALDECRSRFEKLCVLDADGHRVVVNVTTAPSAGDVRDWRSKHVSYPLPVKLGLSAHAALPSGTHAFRIRFPEMLGDLILTVIRPGQDEVACPLQANELSPVFGVVIVVPTESGALAVPQGASQPPDSEGGVSVFARFTILGFRHILPGGMDHCLFVLGLFLLSPRLKPVLLQITAFTLAHTITLTLTSLKVIGLSSHIVEPAIALSVAFIGVENLIVRQTSVRHTAISFFFGLIHGMGVATAFNEAGFPAGRLVPSLAAFTIGVEAGHLTVLAAAFGILAWCRDRPWFRTRVVLPISGLIVLVAVVWLFQRL